VILLTRNDLIFPSAKAYNILINKILEDGKNIHSLYGGRFIFVGWGWGL
jgi:hypothetical protein